MKMSINVPSLLFIGSIASGLTIYILNGFSLHPLIFDLLITPILWILIGGWIFICWPSRSRWSWFIGHRKKFLFSVIGLALLYPLFYFAVPAIWANIGELIANLFSALCSILMIIERFHATKESPRLYYWGILKSDFNMQQKNQRSKSD